MPPPTRPHRARPQLATEEEGRPQGLSAEKDVCPELSFPQGHLPNSARSSRRGSTPMGRPRRAVPDTSAPPAVFNIGDNTPSAVSNTGVDFLHQATTGCSNTMGGVGGSWTNMMMDEIDVDTIPLSVPLDDAGMQTKVTKSKRAGNYTHEEDIQLCVS